MKCQKETVTVELKNGSVVQGTIIGKMVFKISLSPSCTVRCGHRNEHAFEGSKADSQGKESDEHGSPECQRQQYSLCDSA